VRSVDVCAWKEYLEHQVKLHAFVAVDKDIA